jgi:integrase/recombinase XerD
MIVQPGQLPDSTRQIWLVLDDEYQPIEPILTYLSHLTALEKSPNTVRSYAYNLKLYWEFLTSQSIDWQEIKLDDLTEFIYWLRSPSPDGTIPIQPQIAKRTERTVNQAMSTVSMFYEFHQRLDQSNEVAMYGQGVNRFRKFKPLLHHVSKNKESKIRLLKIKEPQMFPGCLTIEQVIALVSGCNRLRDKFIVCMLYETGMRIGELLGLRHEDIRSQGVNEIHIIPRPDNLNGGRVKNDRQRIVHVPKELLKLYSSYLIDEYPDNIDCDYVFVNCWDGEIGQPLQYSSIQALFKRLAKKTGVKANPHLLRHTHATELIRVGWDMSYVQKRLGHSSIQTTINTYVHLTNEDLRTEYDKYLKSKEGNHGYNS